VTNEEELTIGWDFWEGFIKGANLVYSWSLLLFLLFSSYQVMMAGALGSHLARKLHAKDDSTER